MSFYGNNNNNNNNNNGKRFNNRYVVPVSLGTTAAPGTHVPVNSRQSARNVAAEAAQHEQDWQMATRVHRALRRPVSRVSDRDLTTQDSIARKEQGGLATEAN